MENPSAGKTALGLDNNVGAGICYVGNLICALGLIYSIIVLVTDKVNKLPRFHAMQSILLSASSAVIWIAGSIIMAVLGMIKLGVLSILIYLICVLLSLGLLVFMVIACIKAFQGQIYKIPFIGDMADNWSN